MYRIRALATAAMLAVALSAGLAHAEGVLQQLREDVQGTSDAPRDDDDSSRSRRHCDEYPDEVDNPFATAIASLFFQGAWYGITAPFWGPPVWIGDDYSHTSYLSCYPYQHDPTGYVLSESALPESSDVNRWSIRVRGELADNFDSLTRYGGRVLWESYNRFGLDSSVNYYREWLATGRHDELWTGDFNIVFRFAESPQLMMRTGIGANYLSVPHETDLGFNFTYAADWLPARPWIFSAELDCGWLGHAGLFHGRATAGINLGNVECYTGYDYLDVGSAQIDGLVAGIQLWY